MIGSLTHASVRYSGSQAGYAGASVHAMQASSGLTQQPAQPAGAAQSGLERQRHLYFIARHLVTGLIGLLALPPYLFLKGAPAAVDALIFVWALFPLLAVAHLSRTGRLVSAHAICIVGVIGLATTLAIVAPGISVAVSMWLALAPLEALFAASTSLVLATGVGGLVAACFVAAVKLSGLAVLDQPSDLATHFVVLLAIFYATALAVAGVRLIEARRRSEVEQVARYAALSEAVGDLVLRLDDGGAVLEAGRGDARPFGVAAREFIGRGLFERVHVADRPAFLKAVVDAASSDATVCATLRVRRGDNAEGARDLAGRINAALAGEASFNPSDNGFCWLEMRARRLVDMHVGDARRHVVALLRDVTALKQRESELESAREQAESAGVWKDRFLANVSHELRTPLNAIIGFSEILQSEELAPADPAKRREYAGIVHQSGQHLLQVVNSILDMSKIDAGKFDLLPEPFDVKPLIEQCVDMVSLKAMEQGVEVRRDLPARLDEIVADKRAFKQILLNLLSNAVKFTPPTGFVTVTVRPEGNSLTLAIADTGIGIAPHDLARLGDPFFQARGSYDRPYEGTGLGLSVVRGLVGLHGGAIRIESALGAGVSVIVRLPLDCRMIPEAAARPAIIEAVAVTPRPKFDFFATDFEKVSKIA